MTQAITNTILIGMGYSLVSYIPWTIIFLLTQFVGIRLYTIHNREDCQRLQKSMTYCSHLTDGGKGYGYAVGYWLIEVDLLHGRTTEINLSETNAAEVFNRIIKPAPSH
jgi:hypothetical protein